MKTKIIDGRLCQERDVVYSDFGAQTVTDKKLTALQSSTEFKDGDSRQGVFKDRLYSWDREDNPYSYGSDLGIQVDADTGLDKEFADLLNNDLNQLVDNSDSAEDREYSGGTLNMRLVTLRRPLHIQLKDLYREHTRFYRSKKNLKPKDADFLIEDFRYELHRIIAKAKDQVVEKGGNMDTILKISAVGTQGGGELQQTLRKLTILFKRVEQAYIKFGYIPRPYQTQMNDSLSVLISHFILDVYGPELEKRKLESAEISNSIQAR